MIAALVNGRLSGFDDVVANDAGVVAYHTGPTTGVNDSEVFTSNGVRTRTIADANQQAFIGRSVGSPSIHAAGTVAFLSPRTTPSQAVFTGDGGGLATVADTNSIFGQFGNAAINHCGEIAFLRVEEDQGAGVSVATPADEQDYAKPVAPGTIETVTDPNNPIFSDSFIFFGDPVINDAGIVADVAFLSNGNLDIFTGNARGAVARTDPNSRFSTFSEHPSSNNRGAVAFFANEHRGSEGILVELTGGASPIAVIEAGDSFLGSTVTGLDLGRFALNDPDQLAFQYSLQAGRSGIAIASPQKGAREDCESER